MALRIAVIGSHGVGKTTLAERLAAGLGVTFIPESARVVAHTHGYAEPSMNSMEFQQLCLQEQIYAERTNRAGGFVTDRGLVDYLVYPLVLGTFGGRPEQLDSYMMRILDVSFDAYTHVVYVPVTLPLVPDGFRSTSRAYQKAVDTMLRLMAGAVHPRGRAIDLSRSAPDEWYATVLKEVQE